MAANNASVAMPIKDLKPGMNNLNLSFIVIEIGRPTTTKENQVSLSMAFSWLVWSNAWSCRRSGR